MQRVALVCGYDGQGYFGLQRQSDAAGKPTVELELERALVSAGAMRASCAGALHRVNWSRTSRTDKGVSAATNVISLDIPSTAAFAGGVAAPAEAAPEAVGVAAASCAAGAEAAAELAASVSGVSGGGSGGGTGGGASCVDDLPALTCALNAALPPAVRVWGVVRADQAFDARRAACGRRYEYLLPVWSLDSAVGKQRATAQQQQQPSPSLPQSPSQAQASAPAAPTAAAQPAGAAWDGSGGCTTADRSRLRAELEVAASRFELTALELKRLNLVLGVFVGSHCFHNFTSEPCDDPEELRRTIHRAFAEGPVYLQQPGTGGAATGAASTQIRRMVGLALAVARRAAPPDCIRAALDPARRHLTVPTAPPTGLIMDRAFFQQDAYRRACEAQPAAQPPQRAAVRSGTGEPGGADGSAAGGGGSSSRGATP
ncbi:hypothetical protein GPECTOR_21g628 [Gonium pectorale]|uniref:tRNA pseudouridine synthase n=1 Tax=Gonium pectorale TaxID=33097 RepID=A0A150GHS5_GONPE|nr:hypothetical protein GPECTOR_21g628 [Gonium pectorale]|eukprot:KXZ49402.1 hypothetical protein GPECTOR_21g628 [Gonium pectorale]